MDSYLEEKKERLQKQIDIAQAELEKNFANAKISDYISVGAGSVPGFVKGLVDNPGKTVDSGKLITKALLSRSNLIRKTFTTLSYFKTLLKLLVK